MWCNVDYAHGILYFGNVLYCLLYKYPLTST